MKQPRAPHKPNKPEELLPPKKHSIELSGGETIKSILNKLTEKSIDLAKTTFESRMEYGENYSYVVWYGERLPNPHYDYLMRQYENALTKYNEDLIAYKEAHRKWLKEEMNNEQAS